MRKYRIRYDSLISLLLVVLASCSQIEWEQEQTSESIGEDDTLTRSDLIEYTINVETAGTLDSLVEAGNYADAQKLIVTGNIAYEDVNYVDVNMTTVEVLDLSGATYESTDIQGTFLSESCNIKDISLPSNITWIMGDYDNNTWSYVSPFKNAPLTSVTIPEGMRTLWIGAFSGCSSLTNITLPESLEYICDEVFIQCSSLAQINIPEGVTYIGRSAFSGCSSLTDINIPEGVTYIGGGAFSLCSSLTDISIPEGVTSIENGTFVGCSSLVSISIPKGVTNIGSSVFADCTNLTSINIPEGVTLLGAYVFCKCTSLTSITLPENLTYIGDYAFDGCSSLTSITLPESLTYIGQYAFYGCNSLTNINIPEGVTSIDSCTFYGCSSLTDVTIPVGITSIGYSAFRDCSTLTSITLPESLRYIEQYAFYGCNSLTNINIPEGVTSIDYCTFYGCSSLTDVTIPVGITSIGEGAFWGCSSLIALNIHKGVTSIGGGAFYDCSSLTEITLPEGITSIGDFAFRNCSSLISITLPKSLTSIGLSVYSGCSSLQRLACSSSVDFLGDLNSSNNVYCWLIIDSPDGNIPVYGSNWKNVVINGVAESVTLPYHKTLDFTIPEEVKSIKKISYTMNFEENPYSSLYGIWRTIALPFTPTHITHAEKGTLAPFNSEVNGAKNFWLKELTADGFKNVTRIEANHPYLIAMPYSEAYADKYNISGNVTFSAENLTAEDFSSAPLSAEGTDYTMYASYSYMDETDGLYVLNNHNQFVKDNSQLHPFESYVKANTSTLRSVISLSQGRAATRAGAEGKRKPQIDDM
jgi:hypothetical protein